MKLAIAAATLSAIMATNAAAQQSDMDIAKARERALALQPGAAAKAETEVAKARESLKAIMGVRFTPAAPPAKR